MLLICHTNDIPEIEESSGFRLNTKSENLANAYETTIEIEGEKKAIFLLRHEDKIKAFINSCPHTGAKLNWQAGLFLDSDQYYIQCSIHGALFEKDSGLCVHGPCVKQSLTSLEIKVENEKIYLAR